MVSSEQIFLGVMTVGQSSAFHVSFQSVWSFSNASLSRFFSQKSSNLAFAFFFLLCVIDNEVHARIRAHVDCAMIFRGNETRYAGEMCECLLLSFPLFIHNSLLPVPPYKRINKWISFCLRNSCARDRMIHVLLDRPSLLANDGFLRIILTRYMLHDQSSCFCFVYFGYRPRFRFRVYMFFKILILPSLANRRDQARVNNLDALERLNFSNRT